MADEKKKTKIDLKARLGKTTQVGLGTPGVPAPAGVTPPPPSSEPGSNPAPATGTPLPTTTPAIGSVRPPSVPAGIPAPPSGLSPGIPIPPFAQARREPARPEPKPTAVQQTIKVEVGEEIHAERKKWRTRIILGAAAGAVVGLGLGWVAGGSSEKGDRAKAAARGAAALEKDVKTATDKLKELDAKLTDAAEKIKGKNFPDDLSTSLAGLTIPFDSTNLDGKGVNGMPTKLFKTVLAFTSGVENLNKSRESLKNLVGLAKDPMTKAWKEETTPVANFSVIFRNEGGKQMVAELVPNKEPFSWKGDHPGSYTILKLEGGKTAEKKATRWVKGDLQGSDPIAIPIDPKTTAAFSSEVLIGRMTKALYDMRVELNGNKDNPTNETPGLIKMGEDLANDLNKASKNQ
jgi:hypothetical protein